MKLFMDSSLLQKMMNTQTNKSHNWISPAVHGLAVRQGTYHGDDPGSNLLVLEIMLSSI
jgi:hypothetical protein